MVGDYGSVTGERSPLFIDRPEHCKWAPGNSLPKYYLRMAEKTLQSEMQNDHNGVIQLALVVATINVFILLLTLADSFYLVLFIISVVISMVSLPLLWYFGRRTFHEECAKLQQSEFEWRSGILDDIGGEVIAEFSGDGGTEQVTRILAFADGETLFNPLLYGTKLKQKSSMELEFQMHGKTELDSLVTIIRFEDVNGNFKTLILPQNVEFDEH